MNLLHVVVFSIFGSLIGKPIRIVNDNVIQNVNLLLGYQVEHLRWLAFHNFHPFMLVGSSLFAPHIGLALLDGWVVFELLFFFFLYFA